jgi:hypothetical protein
MGHCALFKKKGPKMLFALFKKRVFLEKRPQKLPKSGEV